MQKRPGIVNMYMSLQKDTYIGGGSEGGRGAGIPRHSCRLAGCRCPVLWVRVAISTAETWGWNNKGQRGDERGLLFTALLPSLKDSMSLTSQATVDIAILGTGLFHLQNKVDLLCYFVPRFFAECR